MRLIKAACDHTILSYTHSVYIVNGHWVLECGSHNAFDTWKVLWPCDLFSKLIFALEMSFSAANHDFLIRYIFNKGQPKIKQYLTISDREKSRICITVYFVDWTADRWNGHFASFLRSILNCCRSQAHYGHTDGECNGAPNARAHIRSTQQQQQRQQRTFPNKDRTNESLWFWCFDIYLGNFNYFVRTDSTRMHYCPFGKGTFYCFP